MRTQESTSTIILPTSCKPWCSCYVLALATTGARMGCQAYQAVHAFMVLCSSNRRDHSACCSHGNHRVNILLDCLPQEGCVPSPGLTCGTYVAIPYFFSFAVLVSSLVLSVWVSIP
jgi:hypothetical protein